MLKIVLFLTLPLLVCSQSIPKVLIMAFDGMRWDYINPESAPFIWSLGQKGVFATQGISNQMVTLTAPNFYSISTGLYEEHHGIVGNTFYDPHFNDYYDYWNFSGNSNLARGSRDARWYSGEPIWQTNEKVGGGRVSGAMRWPTCDAKINNITMKYCKPFEGYFLYDEWKKEIDELVSWFKQPTNPINLGLYYNPQPDHIEHGGDIYRQEVRDAISQLDNLTAYLFDQLKSNNLLDDMNIILTADHGHANVNLNYNMLTIDDIVGSADDVIVSQISLFPRTDKGITAEEIYRRASAYWDQHPKFDLYLKQDVPDDWHYKGSDRVGPVVIVEKLGYKITTKSSLPNYHEPVFGQHGYSKSYTEMRPFFVATGPAFKSGFSIKTPEQIQNVDLYPLMAHLLGISSNAPQVDGQFDKVQFILKCEPNCQGKPGSSSASYNLPSAFLAIVVLLAYLLQK